MKNESANKLAALWTHDLLGGKRFGDSSGRGADIDAWAEDEATSIVNQVIDDQTSAALNVRPERNHEAETPWRRLARRLDAEALTRVCAPGGRWVQLAGIKGGSSNDLSGTLSTVLSPFALNPEDIPAREITPARFFVLAILGQAVALCLTLVFLRLWGTSAAAASAWIFLPSCCVGCTLTWGMCGLLLNSGEWLKRIGWTCGALAVGDACGDALSFWSRGKLLPGSGVRKMFLGVVLAALWALRALRGRKVSTCELRTAMRRRVASRIREAVMTLALYAKLSEGRHEDCRADLEALRARLLSREQDLQAMKRDVQTLWTASEDAADPCVKTALERLAARLGLELDSPEQAPVWQVSLSEMYDVLGAIRPWDPYRVIRPPARAGDGSLIRGRVQRWPVWTQRLAPCYETEGALTEGMGFEIVRRPVLSADGGFVRGVVRARMAA